MGEYAMYRGERIKIGTCESMYYLRAEQAGDVQPLPGNVNPTDPDDLRAIRFRFPWPDEDGIEPGALGHGEYERGPWLNLDLPALAHVDHYSVQFKSTNAEGYLVSLPCPESNSPMLTVMAENGIRVGRNGFPGNVRLVEQAWRGGRLVGILQCQCGARFNLPAVEDVQPVLDKLEELAQREDRTTELMLNRGDIETREQSAHVASAERHREIAKRLRAGYDVAVPA